ncbi:protein of unknown function [Nonlabens sp. Hel1_33_55]|uniref:DUF1206 domain-containing protein n=1 Tax=Nonlabens sp. Hel1_33_55 TaxID=1336802 RepID=UPI000875D148|nr:DUF1206 domain-containing protein [Nonlabens sp. Hel1_33_55]SCX96426.1 protein of unknown function [Nonlabens sp. Hel1_33_55]
MKNSRRFSRIGIVTKGIVFFLLGFMAFVTACNLANALKNEREVIEWIYGLSIGWFLLLLMTIGLVGYIFSRFYLTFNNSDYDGSNSKPTFRRAAYLINGLGYCLLLFTCVTVLIGAQNDDDSNIKLMVLQSDFGKVLVFIVAVGLAVSAVNEWWISFSSMMDKMTHSDDLTARQYKYLMLLGRFGRFSRGIVFAVFAYVLARSAYYSMDNLPDGFDAAFAFISVTYGAFFMGVVSFGIICYGMFLIMSGKHRNIPIK